MTITARLRDRVSTGDMRCPYCFDQLGEDDEVSRCDRCSTALHTSCFEEYGRCTVVGCAGRPARDRAPDEAVVSRLLTRLAQSSGTARLRMVERLLRFGVPEDRILTVTGAEDRLARVAMLSAAAASGDDASIRALVALVDDPASNGPERSAALRALNLVDPLPDEVLELALRRFEEPALRTRCEWILSRIDTDRIGLVLDAAVAGAVEWRQAYDALTGGLSRLHDRERSEALDRVMHAAHGRPPAAVALAEAIIARAMAQTATESSVESGQEEAGGHLALAIGGLAFAAVVRGLAAAIGDAGGFGAALVLISHTVLAVALLGLGLVLARVLRGASGRQIARDAREADRLRAAELERSRRDVCREAFSRLAKQGAGPPTGRFSSSAKVAGDAGAARPR